MSFPRWLVHVAIGGVVVGGLLSSCSEQEEPARDPRLDCSRTITDDLMLMHCDPSEAYYVVRSFAPDADEDGPLDGRVVKIGWNDRYLWAERTATFRADLDGWMIIDTRQHLVLGPYSNDAFAERSKVIGEGNAVESIAPEEAWKRLERVEE